MLGVKFPAQVSCKVLGKDKVLGWCRVRWSCAALAMTLAALKQIKVSRETVRLELKAATLRLEARQAQRP